MTTFIAEGIGVACVLNIKPVTDYYRDLKEKDYTNTNDGNVSSATRRNSNDHFYGGIYTRR